MWLYPVKVQVQIYYACGLTKVNKFVTYPEKLHLSVGNVSYVATRLHKKNFVIQALLKL